MTVRIWTRCRRVGCMALTLAIASSFPIASQTDAGPPSIGDMSIRSAEVRDFASFPEAVVLSLAFSPDSQALACSLDDGRVLLLNVADGTVIRALPSHSAAATSVSFSPDGRWIASSSTDAWVYVTSLSDGEEVASLRHQGAVYEAEFSPQGTYLGTAGEDRAVRLWDTATWSELPPITGHTNTVYALAFSPAEDLIVTGSGDADPSIRLWDLATGDELQRDLYEGTVYDIEYSPRARDRHATIAGTQRTIWLWEVDRGAMLHLVGRFGGAVADAAYSSAGNTLVAVCEDGTLFFTTMPSWTEKRSIAFNEPLTAVAFSDSRQYIACSDAVGRVFLLYIR